MKILFIKFLVVIVVSTGYNQVDMAEATQQFLNVISPSKPTMAHYSASEPQLDLSTGKVTINIPLLTVEGKSGRFPLSINYQTGGIKVDDISSSVGLGWNFNTGGFVGRSIIGTSPDEYGYSTNQIETEFLYADVLKLLDLAVKKKRYMDIEPDLFSYFLPNGESGEFFFRKGENQVVFHPYKNYSFEKNDGIHLIQ